MTNKLQVEPRLQNPDTTFKALAQLHDGLTAEESLLINAKLVLLLANHIGDDVVVLEAIEKVRLQKSPD